MASDEFERAHAMRRQVLGDAFADKLVANTDSFNRPFQEFTLKNVFGGTWLDGALSMRELAMVNIALMAGMGRPDEAEIYMRVALVRAGVTPEQLRVLLMHLTVHCGTPVGRGLFQIARRVLAEEGIDTSALDAPPAADAGPPSP